MKMENVLLVILTFPLNRENERNNYRDITYQLVHPRIGGYKWSWKITNEIKERAKGPWDIW